MAPAPRLDMHYMTKFQNVTQEQLVSSASGSCTVVICPQSMFNSIPSNVGSVINYYPWLSVNNVTPLIPFQSDRRVGGPFSATSVVLRAPDVTNVRFVNTMNDLQSSGKLVSSIFY